MRIFKPIPLVVLYGLVATLAVGEDFWLKKNYRQWSAEETRRLLEDSPWATSLTLSSALNVAPAISGGAAQTAPTYASDSVSEPTIVYQIQFRSAAPVREAMVRSSQLLSRYDAMSVDQQAAFDANASKFLAVTFPDRVVVSVTFRSNVQNYQSLLRVYWEGQNAAKLHESVYLNVDKDRLPVQGYAFQGDTFQFIFARPKTLRPDSQVGVEFIHPTVDQIRNRRVLLDFKVKKMLLNGEPVL